MKTGMAKCLWMMVVFVALLVAVGCNSLRPTPNLSAVPDAALVTPVVLNDATMGVLQTALDKDSPILASALSAAKDGASCIYIDHQGFVYDPAGNVVMDGKGNPLRLRTQIMAQLASLQALKEMGGASKLKYTVGGRGYLRDLPDHLKHVDQCPVALEIEVDGLSGVRTESPTPAIIAARTAEREAIFAGLAAEIRERYIGRGRVIEAVSNGLTQVIATTGEKIIGELKGFTLVGAAGEAAKVLIKPNGGDAVQSVSVAAPKEGE